VWSALGEPIAMPGRTDFFLLPGFLLLVGAGVAAAGARLRLATVPLLAAAAALATVLRPRQAAAFDEGGWLAPLQARLRRGDVVVCTDLTRLAAEYYLTATGATLLSYPADMAVELAHFNDDWYARHVDAHAEAATTVAAARAALSQHGALWVVTS